MEKNNWNISIKTLGIILISFILGFVVNQLYLKITTVEISNLKAIDLINFVISIILSSASIVLAITSITLGKSTENILVRRNDESIRLQNEVYLRTNEVLSRIASSTDVTEKRIEDIISGRVGNISQDLANRLTTKPGMRKSKDEIEKEIRESLEKEIGMNKPKTPEETEKLQKEAEMKKEYNEFHQKMLRAFSNRKDSKVVKTLHGSFSGHGDELFDGIYEFKQFKIGVSALKKEDTSSSGFKDYIMNVARELAKDTIKYSFIFLLNEEDLNLANEFDSDLSLLKNDPRERLRFIYCNNGTIEEIISNLNIE